MNVLFMSQPDVLHPYYDEFCAGAPSHYRVRLYDAGAPTQPQFEGIGVVVEVGGSFADTTHLDAGAAADVVLWQILGTGLDHVDVEGFLRRGIRLANTPGQFSAVALGEHALFLMLLFAKRFAETQESILAERLCVPVASELAGQTLGLVGFGASARELARRASAFAMRIVAYDVEPVPHEDQQALGAVCHSDIEALDRVVAEADYLSVHVPLTRATRQLIGERLIGLMKPTAVIINVSRGEVIDEPALARALREGRLHGAGLDVFATEPLPAGDPLRQLANVIATPHVAGVTAGTARRRAHAALENIARVERGLDPFFIVRSAE